MRVNSYFQKSSFLSAAKIKMLEEAKKTDCKKTDSEIDALILESNLIKKYQPKYNVLMRDDKQYFYVGLTREKFPKIFITHRPMNHQTESSKIRGNFVKRDYIGPFTDGAALKSALRMLRQIFPFCVCKTAHKRPCQQSQIKKCLGFCCIKPEFRYMISRFNSDILCRNEYKNNISAIFSILKGRKKGVMKNLKKELQKLIKNKEYEKAETAHKKVQALEKIFKHKLVLTRDENSYIQKASKYLKNMLKFKKEVGRIEAYDISNMRGKDAVGSMAVFENGKTEKSEYRQFKIKTVRSANDTAMLKEIIKRRLRHSEWPAPDLMLIDGGKAQLNAVISVFQNRPQKIVPLVAAFSKTKDNETLFLKHIKIKSKNIPPSLLYLLQNIRNEAHRFGIKQHKKLRKKTLFG